MAERWTRKHRGHSSSHQPDSALNSTYCMTQLYSINWQTSLNKSKCQLQEIYTSFSTQYSFTSPKEILLCWILDVLSHLDTWMLCSNNSSRTKGIQSLERLSRALHKFLWCRPHGRLQIGTRSRQHFVLIFWQTNPPSEMFAGCWDKKQQRIRPKEVWRVYFYQVIDTFWQSSSSSNNTSEDSDPWQVLYTALQILPN